MSARIFVQKMNQILRVSNPVQLSIRLSDLCAEFNAKSINDFHSNDYYQIGTKIVFINPKTSKFEIR